jgi:hypothetical protein
MSDILGALMGSEAGKPTQFEQQHLDVLLRLAYGAQDAKVLEGEEGIVMKNLDALSKRPFFTTDLTAPLFVVLTCIAAALTALTVLYVVFRRCAHQALKEAAAGKKKSSSGRKKRRRCRGGVARQ